MNTNELDPQSASSQEEFAVLLRRVRGSSPSLRDLERWARQQRDAGRPVAPLHRTTVGDVLAGRRLPSAAVLEAFLEACGIVGASQQPWLRTRTRIEEQKLGLIPGPSSTTRSAASQPRDTSFDDDPSPPAAEVASRRTGRRSRSLFIAASFMALAVVLIALAVITGQDRQNADNTSTIPSSVPPEALTPTTDFSTTLECIPATCAGAARIGLTGTVSGSLPAGYEPHVLIRVESTGRWYLGQTIVAAPDGIWTTDIGIGNPDPQAKDRQFTICAHLLPTATIDDLTRRLQSYGGEGLPVVELPPDRTELTCTSAVRLANS